jgi:hypothetical protein
MANFTPTQGRYLSFIQAYRLLHGVAPAESDIAAALCVSPPSVNLMVKTLEKKGLISRKPGEARSLEILIPDDEVPPWNKATATKTASGRSSAKQPPVPSGQTVNLYVLSVYLTSGLMTEKFIKKTKQMRRDIEIRGDQTLEDLHNTIFDAFDRFDSHLYEFQLGKRPFDPKGPNYGIPGPGNDKKYGDARKTTLDDLQLQLHRVFGYLFDFGDEWFHQVSVEKIEQSIPTVTYPRITRRIGKSPPQYPEEE